MGNKRLREVRLKGSSAYKAKAYRHNDPEIFFRLVERSVYDARFRIIGVERAYLPMDGLMRLSSIGLLQVPTRADGDCMRILAYAFYQGSVAGSYIDIRVWSTGNRMNVYILSSYHGVGIDDATGYGPMPDNWNSRRVSAIFGALQKNLASINAVRREYTRKDGRISYTPPEESFLKLTRMIFLPVFITAIISTIAIILGQDEFGGILIGLIFWCIPAGFLGSRDLKSAGVLYLVAGMFIIPAALFSEGYVKIVFIAFLVLSFYNGWTFLKKRYH